MLKSRLLGAVGIVAVAVGVLTAQTLASPASNSNRLSSLPDDPCDLLTRDQVAIATGLEVTDMQRLPSETRTVQAANAGEPDLGALTIRLAICGYETRSEFGAVYVVVPAPMDRTAISYRQARDRGLRRSGSVAGSARMIPGVGKDAWLSGGTGLHVLTRQGEYFIVEVRMNSRHPAADLLVALARAVLDRLE